jgi:pilus assembly protein CpaE
MRTYILSDLESLATEIRDALVRRGYDCPSNGVVPLADYPLLADSPSDLVVLCLSPDPDRALIALTEIRSAIESQVLVVGPGTDPKLILRTMRGGADEFITEDELPGELDIALSRLKSGARTKQVGKTIAILGATGGSGASTIAVNLASTFAREHGGAILIDLRLETGDLAALLDLEPQHTISDLCSGYSTPDRDMLEQSFVSHGCGLRLLASPRRQASAIRSKSSMSGPGVTTDTIREVLNLARTMSPHTVVEVNSTFREEQTQALRMADTVLLVFRLDFTSLRNTRRVLEHLDSVGIDRTRVRLVGNRHSQQNSIKSSDAEEALDSKLFHIVPDDPNAMNIASNVGEPCVLGLPKAPSSKSLMQLAASLVGASK